MRSFTRLTKTLSLVGAFALVGAACGDDDGGTPDARPLAVDAAQLPDADTTPDANNTPDAGMAQLRSGVIAITEVKVSNDLSAFGLGEISGAVVSTAYSDLTTATVAPSTGTPGALGDCTVFVYEVGVSAPPTLVDEGAVTVTGAGLNPTTFPTCAWLDAKKEYVCFAAAPAATPANTVWSHTWTDATLGGTGLTLGFVTSILTVPGADFSGMEGMGVSVAGFPEPVTGVDANNGSFGINIVSPIGAAPNNAQVLVVNTTVAAGAGNAFKDSLDAAGTPVTQAKIDAANAAASGTAAALSGSAYVVPTPADASHIYFVAAGAAPIIQIPGAAYDFITNVTDTVSVTKTAGPVVGAFTIATPLVPAGEGLTLKAASPKPHEFPTTAADWALTCDLDDIDGSCGGKGVGSALNGFTVSGITTDGSLTEGCTDNPGGVCGPLDMPPAATKWAEFTCIGNIGSDTITLAMEDIAAVLGTNPTRVQTRVLRTIIDQGASNSATAILVGHGLIGFTDM